jgi:hypothetical protein
MHYGGIVGFFGRLGLAMKAGAVRTKMGGAQGVLQIRLKQFPLDSPQVGEILAQLTTGAWSLDQVSGFFKGLGFTYEDFALMYREIIRAAPLVIGHNYLATLMMVDRLSENVQLFRRAADTVAMVTKEGGSKNEALTDYIAFCLKDAGTQLGEK